MKFTNKDSFHSYIRIFVNHQRMLVEKNQPFSKQSDTVMHIFRTFYENIDICDSAVLLKMANSKLDEFMIVLDDEMDAREMRMIRRTLSKKWREVHTKELAECKNITVRQKY